MGKELKLVYTPHGTENREKAKQAFEKFVLAPPLLILTLLQLSHQTLKNIQLLNTHSRR